jgi:acyl-CoA synthetase (AMP-forming)/AMP-acid ligase II
MYFEKLVARTGKPVGDIFPDFSLLVYGGVNYEPYRQAFDSLIGRHVDTVELYPASEGFIAYQDSNPEKGLLLNVNSGIFFEFIPADKVNAEIPERIPLQGVELGKDYAIVLSSNAGLWGYNLGDTVRFVSRDPYRLTVSGRVSQFISAFGEHVIASEVESAIAEVCRVTGIRVDEFTVAPFVNPPSGLPHHQWLIEFGMLPAQIQTPTQTIGETQNIVSLQGIMQDQLQHFASLLDQSMCKRNTYYNDLITGHVIEPLHICSLPGGTFRKYQASIGKLGGQNKVAHLSDNRDIVEELIKGTPSRGMESLSAFP